jgi:hypothetical protein
MNFRHIFLTVASALLLLALCSTGFLFFLGALAGVLCGALYGFLVGRRTV